MKTEKLLLIAMLSSGSLYVQAQGWTDDATNNKLYTTTLTRPVGIGTNSPQQPFHVVGRARFDLNTTGLGNGRFYFNRPLQTNYENLITFTTGGTTTYDWAFGTPNGSLDYTLNGWTAGKVLTILQSNGNVGIGSSIGSPAAKLHVGGDQIINGNLGLGTGTIPTVKLHVIGDQITTGSIGVGVSSTPAAKLQVNGDIMFGSAALKRKWRLTTQNWIDGGKLFIQPELQDGSGNADGTQGIAIDPISGNCVFGNEGGTTHLATGNMNTNNTSFTNGTSYIGFNARRSKVDGSWASYGSASANGGAVIWGNTEGSLLFSPQMKVGATNTYNDDAVKNRKTMEIRWNYTTNTGQVVIGPRTITSGTHTDFRLSVDGKVLATEIYVTQSNWADYVFSGDYKLKSLNELEQYININKHLPNVPTTAEITENGNNTAETDKILLEKIEELTLYIIQQNKRIEELERSVNK